MSFEIVCPDGQVRHLPHTQEDDARFDALCCTRRCCDIYGDAAGVRAALEVTTPCPGGKHTVRPCRERGLS